MKPETGSGDHQSRTSRPRNGLDPLWVPYPATPTLEQDEDAGEPHPSAPSDNWRCQEHSGWSTGSRALCHLALTNYALNAASYRSRPGPIGQSSLHGGPWSYGPMPSTDVQLCTIVPNYLVAGSTNGRTLPRTIDSVWKRTQAPPRKSSWFLGKPSTAGPHEHREFHHDHGSALSKLRIGRVLVNRVGSVFAYRVRQWLD